MRRVGTREFKNRLGRYLRAVREGQTFVITARGKAVAKGSPTSEVVFMSSDKQLAEAAKTEGFETFNPQTQALP